ncbi:MAG: HD domain-containing protein [Oscillospiraceae bacterium]|nr:HD domain-containing protein [Oscillospiraceae bacterium]
MKNANIIEIITHALSLIDDRLIDHGKNVALTTYSAMRRMGTYSEREINDMFLLAVLHDIGSFKNEDTDRISKFDSGNVWPHSILGYLFVRDFTPLTYLAPVLLCHHATEAQMAGVPEYFRGLSRFLRAADRLEIATRFGGLTDADTKTYLRNQGVFPSSVDAYELFFGREPKLPDRDALWASICDAQMRRADIEKFLEMVILSIDFRSRATVSHTVSTAQISRLLAEVMGFPAEDVTAIGNAALLHDIGKTGIPTEILESPGKLVGRDLEIMRSHVLLTEQILTGRVSDTVMRIAARHHEKLDGSGYHRGLCAASLTMNERLVAVTDILSACAGARSYKDVFPKERVVSILTEMSGGGLLDPVIVSAAVEHYDHLIDGTADATLAVTRSYDALQDEYRNIRHDVAEMERTGDFALGVFFK